MSEICENIYWYRMSNIELAFDLSDEDYNRCLIEHHSGAYEEFTASEELTALPADQLM